MFANMKLGMKMALAMGVLTLISVVVGVISFYNTNKMDENSVRINKGAVPSSVALLNIKSGMNEILIGERGLLNRRIFVDQEMRNAQKTFLDNAIKNIDKHWKVYEALEHSKDEKNIWDKFSQIYRGFMKDHESFMEIFKQKEALYTSDDKDNQEKMDAIDTAMFKQSLLVRKSWQETRDDLDSLVELSLKIVEDGSKTQDEITSSAKTTLTLAIVLSILIAAAFIFFFVRNIGKILRDMQNEFDRIREAAVQGRLNVRGDVDAINHEFRPIIVGANEILDNLIAPVNVAATYVDRISKGDIPPKITDTYHGDFNELKNNLNQCIDAVNALVADTNALSEAAVQGRLATRADATKHNGDFRKIVKGVNDTLDAVIGPLNVAAKYVDRISKGDIPAKITDNYNGDFNEIKNNLNQCIDAVNALVADANALSEAAVQGKLATRADATKHNGDFRKIVKGVNDTLDAVIGPLNVAAKYVDRISKGDIPAKITDNYNGDFNEIKNNLNQCIDAVNALVADAVMLAKAAVEGKLSTRSDATKHNGDFKKIVQGVNETLDAVLEPINDAAKVLQRLSERDLRARVTGNYQGDHAIIKEACNSTAEALHDALSQVAEAVEQVTGAANQIASSSQAVAEGASEQASSLEETSSSLEEMASMTKQNADNAMQANSLAKATRGAADGGANAMQRMMDAMGKIKTASEGTSQIIRDINEIAFQTNLLALNAAVEAARAGEAGRGFAVVAEEVRNLALRSKEAAKKTEELIRESVSLAAEGENLSADVNKKLEEIVNSIAKVSDIVGEIAAASQEQSKGIDQVNSAVAQMDKVTQQNAANSEESSSAAEELNSQAQELAATVGQFQLNRSTGGNRRLTANTGMVRNTRHVMRSKNNGGGGIHLKPEEIIPLDDDADFKDF